jgi:hypothetical protein
LPDLDGGTVEPLPEEDGFDQRCEQLSSGARGEEGGTPEEQWWPRAGKGNGKGGDFYQTR